MTVVVVDKITNTPQMVTVSIFCILCVCIYIYIYIYIYISGPGSSVSIATYYGLDGPGSNSGGDNIFRPYRSALRPTHPPVK